MAAPSPLSPLTQNWNHNTATTLLAIAAIGVLLVPGALVGALLAWAVWWVTRPPILVTWLLGALGAATAAAQASALSVAWPWQLLAASVGINQSAPSTNAIATSLPVEALFGPLVLVVARHGVDHWWRTIQGQEWARARAVAAQKKALERGWPGPDGAKPPTDNGGAPGVIRLGVLAEDGRPFDIAIGELGQHVFLPGASGTGKTMTIARHNTEVYAPSQSLCLTRWIFYGMNLHTKLDLTFAGADCTQMERPLAGDLLSYLTH